MSLLRQLRPHQERALIALRASLVAGKRRPMLQAPTGAGKTLLSAHIIQRTLDKGKRVAFTVPALSLIDQTVAAFEAEGIHCIGVMQGIHERTDREQPVQVCSIQTIARRRRPDVDLVIVDEAHQLHREVFRWMRDCPNVSFIGLSATPWSRGLGKYYDDLVVAATTKELIEAGYLSRYIVFAPSQPDLAGIKTVAGDYHEAELAERVDTAKLVGDVVGEWLKRGENRPTLCYGVNRKHAEHLKQRFEEAGIAAAYIDCFVEREDRERIFDRFRAGEVRVICNVNTLSTGLDLPMASCLIDARPTKSRSLYIQTIGRVLRTAPGKADARILDHSGNCLRLGLPEDIHQERLDNGETGNAAAQKEEAKKSEPLPRLCEQCSAVLPARSNRCSACGHERMAKSRVIHADGELIEFGAHRSGKQEATIADKAVFYGELKSIAAFKGYSGGWASHKYKEKFGVWPNDPRVRGAETRSPSLATQNWVKSRSIAFAKARARTSVQPQL